MAASTIRIMTLNLRFGLAKDGPNAWHHRQRAYPPLFHAHPCDFYCFQEANGFQVEALSDWLQTHRPVGIRAPAPPFWQHNPIYHGSPWQPVSWERIYLSATPETPSRQRTSKWPRQCTLGHFRRGNHELICVNTHFDFAPETQRASARIIARRLSRYPAAVPCVITGDFNAVPGGRCHRLMTGSGWVPGRRFRAVFGDAAPGSYHGYTGTGNGRHIDWILADGGFEVAGAAVIDAPFDGIFPSDHFPVVAELEIEA